MNRKIQILVTILQLPIGILAALAFIQTSAKGCEMKTRLSVLLISVVGLIWGVRSLISMKKRKIGV